MIKKIARTIVKKPLKKFSKWLRYILSEDDPYLNKPNFAPGFDETHTQVQLVGADGLYQADVEILDGKRRMLTDSIVKVEEVFGQDRFADVWIYIGTAQDSYGVGNAGDTLRVQIGARDNAAIWPAVDVTTTVTLAMTLAMKPEVELAKQVILDLNADSNFTPHFKATLIKDTSIVHITAKVRGEWGERPNAGDFLVTTTGTTVALAAYDRISMRGKSTSLSRDPYDPRVGILGISGTVSVIPGAIGNLYLEHPYNATYGIDFNRDGSTTPIVYSIPLKTGYDILIKEIRFFGTASSIKFLQFLSLNAPLTNGIVVEVKSDDQTLTTADVIKVTEDFKHEWTFGGDWILNDQPGAADFLSTFVFETPFPLRAPGTFPTDDYLRVTIRDNLSAITKLRALAFGFTREV